VKLALPVICLSGCAYYLWRIFSTPVHEAPWGAGSDVAADGEAFMSENDKLERVAAKLDDISETLEEIRSAVVDGTPASKQLDGVQSDVKRAADAIEEVVDPD
jgi:hypothetical protein